MKNSRKMQSMPVVSLEDGNQVGKVKNLLLDATGKKVAGLVLDQKGLFKDSRVVPFDQIKSIGEHAITVDKSTRAERPANLPHLAKLMKEQVHLIGTQVITEEGNILGTVEEFFFDGNTGKITLLVLGGGRLMDNLFKGKAALPASALVTLGKSAIIARRGAEDLLEKDEGAMQETVKSVKETSAKVWDSTLKATKKLGETLHKSMERFSPEKQENPRQEQPTEDNRNREIIPDQPPEPPAPPVEEPVQEPERRKAN
ncbi:MAG: PRC-barrel domain-containing protein [Bacillota bacterium]